MGENGLLAPHRVGRNQEKTHDGTIVTDKVNEMWGTDMSQAVTLEEGRAYVFVAVEHANSEIVGIHAARSANLPSRSTPSTTPPCSQVLSIDPPCFFRSSPPYLLSSLECDTKFEATVNVRRHARIAVVICVTTHHRIGFVICGGRRRGRPHDLRPLDLVR